jgi:hypothetical protein
MPLSSFSTSAASIDTSFWMRRKEEKVYIEHLQGQVLPGSWRKRELCSSTGVMMKIEAFTSDICRSWATDRRGRNHHQSCYLASHLRQGCLQSSK